MASGVRFSEIQFAADPLPDLHEVLAELREIEPVSRLVFAGDPVWVFNDDESVYGPI